MRSCSSCCVVVVLTWMVLVWHPATAAQEEEAAKTSINNNNNNKQPAACDLYCENGGFCEYVSDDNDELSALVQRGAMIQKCVCPTGFGGTGCEIVLQECGNDGKCHNGRPCSAETGTCECADAEHVSKFAGMMCHRPYTEYCADRYHPDDDNDEPLQFCTNGGKCKSSIIAAQVAPGNTTMNDHFSHMGCICPLDFYGPHCELLKYDRAGEDSVVVEQAADEDSGEEQEAEDPQTTDDETFMFDDTFWSEPNKGAADKDDQGLPLSIVLAVTTSASAIVILACLYYRRIRRRRTKHSPEEYDHEQSRCDPPSIKSFVEPAIYLNKKDDSGTLLQYRRSSSPYRDMPSTTSSSSNPLSHDNDDDASASILFDGLAATPRRHLDHSDGTSQAPLQVDNVEPPPQEEQDGTSQAPLMVDDYYDDKPRHRRNHSGLLKADGDDDPQDKIISLGGFYFY